MLLKRHSFNADDDRLASTKSSAHLYKMSGQQPYQLAFTLQGHAGDVRSLSAPSPDVPLLLSSSRDGSAIVWGPSRDGMWEVKLRVEGPERKYVSCVGLTRHGGQGLYLGLTDGGTH